ncbi:hypothetical protein WAI453_010283 [Rhynchosporium graminicola]
MSANSSSLARWTDEEHQILVQLTNDQIELESNDHSQEISWAAHWRKVSAQLQASGYNRSNTACQSYWKRVAETQKANEEAAGPRWDDQEHQILLGMTEDQLALEKEDPSAVIPWPKHWKKVSLRLQESGYHRTPNACAAYWLKVGYDFSVDTYEPETSTFQKRFDVEHMAEDEDSDADEDSDSYSLKRRERVRSRSHPELTERRRLAALVSTASQAEKPQDEKPQPEELPEPKNVLLSNAAPNFTPSITPAPSEKDPSDDESYNPRQREPTKSKMSQMPTKAESTSPKSRSPKVPLRRGFRFTGEQRIILEAEAAKFGTYPSVDRIKELARELKVKEKTIRNWFVHRRSHKGQTILSNMTTPGPSGHDDSFVDEGSPAISNSGAKRMPSFDRKESYASASDDIQSRPTKRVRVDGYDHEYHEAPQSQPYIDPAAPVTSSDIRYQRSFEGYSNMGIPISNGHPQNPPNPFVASPSEAQNATATSMSPFPPPNNPVEVRTTNSQGVRERLRDFPAQQEGPRPGFNESPSIPAPVAGTEWLSMNSTRPSDFQAVNPAIPISTSAPHALPSNGTPLNHHPYTNVVSANPPPPHPMFQQPVSVSPLPRPSTNLNEQPVSASPLPRPSTNLNEKDEKEWMSSKASRIQTEIENLQYEKAARIHKLGSIDQRINEISNEENAIEEMKEKEIRQAIREIEERHKGRNEYVKAQQQDLARVKDVELTGLHKNVADLKRKTTALKLVQDLVDLYDEE